MPDPVAAAVDTQVVGEDTPAVVAATQAAVAIRAVADRISARHISVLTPLHISAAHVQLRIFRGPRSMRTRRRAISTAPVAAISATLM
ncbi:MAG TPA: hypothetical protein VK825_06820 [Xanthobacteraceae bacterium]|nr:hypothetical protein [Xanthobacteraceae bacterium]